MDDVSSPPPVLPTIDYVNSKTAYRPRSLRRAKRFLIFSVSVPSFGVLILLLFYFTHLEFLSAVGAIYLLAGGVMAFACIVFGLVQALIRGNGEDDTQIRGFYLSAFAAGIISFPIAFVCMQAGADEMRQPFFSVTVYNDTDRSIDRVSVLFDKATVDVGPITPHSSGGGWWHYRYSHTQGPLMMRVTANGKTVERTDQIYCDNLRLNQSNLAVHVEPKELPR